MQTKLVEEDKSSCHGDQSYPGELITPAGEEVKAARYAAAHRNPRKQCYRALTIPVGRETRDLTQLQTSALSSMFHCVVALWWH